MSVHRLPDGSTAFLCGRGAQPDPHEKIAGWIGEEAARQGRCPRCLSPVAENCGGADGRCRKPLLSTAQAVAVLKGMVTG